ncbi:MAG TPA: hypothetical protein VFY20_00905 [Gemmatimonadales bacterium]|nr:hypothetical protein [Gemmatimonadales bacterium]
MRALPVVALVALLLVLLPYVVPLARRALAPGRAAWRGAVAAAPRVLATVVDITPFLLRRESARGLLVRRGDGAYVAIARHSDRTSGRLQSVARPGAHADDATIVDIAAFRARRDARLRRAARIAALPPRSGISVAHPERIVSSDTMEHLA